MRFPTTRLIPVCCALLALSAAPAQARDNVLTAIPSDAMVVAVVHNLADASRSIDELAKLVQAPAPDLLGMAKGRTNLQKGIDEQGDLAVVLTSVDPVPKAIVLIPIANFADFFAALNVQEPAAGVVEVQLGGAAKLVGRKGAYAALANESDRDALEQLLSANTNLAADASLATWLDANKASVVVTAPGLKQLIPKLADGIRNTQAKLRQLGGPQGQTAADGFNMYLQLLTVAEPEVQQFGVGVRIDSAQTVDFVKRVQFTSAGAWAKWAAGIKPAVENLLAGLPSGPFFMAMGGVAPQGMTEQFMKLSVQMMQINPLLKLTPEQAEKYLRLSTESMRDVKSVRMLMGVTEPGAGLYGRTTVVVTVDDAKGYLDRYEKSLAAIREFAQETKNPMIPAATSNRVKLGDLDVLEVSMDLTNVMQASQPGAPDPQKTMQLMFGPSGKLTIYVAPADEHTVVMAYTSLDQLKAALEFCKSKQPGLSADAGIAKVTAMLPQGSQVVAYASLSGLLKLGQQFAANMPGVRPGAIPDLPDSPPIGMAAKVNATGVEGHLVVTADTLRAIGDTVSKFRRPATAPAGPPQ